MAQINTTHGLLDESTLARTVGFEDRPNEFVVWVEWRLGDELVRRDAHVILKQASEIAGVLAGGHARDVTVSMAGVKADGSAGGLG